ncbi:MAG: hypothetical protein R3C10_07665 [Pirellulales bacterium]
MINSLTNELRRRPSGTPRLTRSPIATMLPNEMGKAFTADTHAGSHDSATRLKKMLVNV